MTGLTQELGRFVADLTDAALPAPAAATVRRGIADCVGVAFAARGEPVVDHARALIDAGPPGAASASLWLDGRAAAPADAAFGNAVAAHALDYDDTGLDGHPSVVLAPAVLAEAQARGLTWGNAVTAYVAGYEVWAELSGRDADRHHGKGWHPTAVFGTLACAAAGARLRRLGAAQAAHALGIAASMAAGLVANFGSDTKPLQVGWAARNGLLAARLAAGGATAAVDVLERHNGFLAAISPAGRVDRDRPAGVGLDWQIVRQGLNVKRYPACYAVHRLVDATLELRARLPQPLPAIRRIEASVGRLQAAMLRASRPDRPLDAKFSAQYAVACALLRGRVGLAEFTGPAVDDGAVQALLRRVEVRIDERQDPEEPLFAPDDRVTVELEDGTRVQSAPVRRALGHASRPIDDDALREKFLDCTRAALGPPAARQWWLAVTAPPSARVAWPAAGPGQRTSSIENAGT